MAFKPVSPNVSLPQLENELISYWKEQQIFEKSVSSRPADKTWTFLDGPPFITGKPHYGTLLPSILKDVYPRYWTMKGFRVRRVWGWDCHGLPAENKVEKQLGIKRKRDIEEKVGVKKFIDECKKYVNEVSSEWEWYINHIGRWVDFKNAYKTMDRDYMETVMWVFKQMYDRKFIYKGLRVSLYCPHCSTPISNFEVAMDADNYQDITEPSNTYKYQLADQPDTYFLAWSTTPWTKLATPALAVNPKLTYVRVKQGEEKYILAKTTLAMLKPAPYVIEAEFIGQKLLGQKFIPHYDFYKIDPDKKAFIIIGGDFVTAEEGTGIVTIAAYGEEDLKVMQRDHLQIVIHLDDEGRFTSDVPNWAGMNYLEANPLINQDLANRNLLYSETSLTHSVPTCWRCHTRLYYSPQSAWYVDVQSLKKLMEKTNQTVNWFPSHFKLGRFLKSMQQAPDWCISRSRYWGSPVPVWECTCGWRFVPGSIQELITKSGHQISDLHKPEIDQITVKCDQCHQDAHRVPEVLDSWIEAGSASFAERHFPFNTDHKLADFFPPDFIVEYTGQIRAWFYVLHVISAALYKSPAFKNVAVTGVILGTDGRKMSKNFGNYPDPKELLEKYGGDAIRLYFAGSPVTKGEDILISEEEYKQQVRSPLLTLWNCFNFFISNANSDAYLYQKDTPLSTNVLDTWFLALTKQLVNQVTASLENYDSCTVVSLINQYVTHFSTWFIRRSRDRVGPTAIDDPQDKAMFYHTCFTCLITFCQVAAPIIPFITESIYINLTGSESVHLTDWPPMVPLTTKESTALKSMTLIRHAVELGLSKRKEVNLKVRQPLQSMTITSPFPAPPKAFLNLLLDEVNLKTVNWNKSADWSVNLDTHLTDQLRAEGAARELIRQVQELRKTHQARLDQKISLTLPSPLPQPEILDLIKKQTLSVDITLGNQLEIKLL